MAIKQDAWERIQQKLDDSYGETQEDRNARREHLMRKQMETEDGREFLWEFVACAQALRMKPYTGNSDCYYILGMRAWPEGLLSDAKRSSLNLYHKMESEAMQREETRRKQRRNRS